MASDLNALYDDLRVLTEQQIEIGLAAGKWDEGERELVEYYLDRIKLEEAKVGVAKQRQLLQSIEQAALMAVRAGKRANLLATAAVMLAVITMGVLVYLALGR